MGGTNYCSLAILPRNLSHQIRKNASVAKPVVAEAMIGATPPIGAVELPQRLNIPATAMAAMDVEGKDKSSRSSDVKCI